ncbi:MAG: hypothetical protein HC804_14490 [Anaerolineae bacterium]|nr:hypothetical protein [Anaerolineae bacterium]
MTPYPSLEDFLAAPLSKVAQVSPTTMIFAAGGTRRSAVLSNVSLQSDAYAHWSRERMMACFELLFQHGVSHIFTFAIVESQLQEVTDVYRQQLLNWVDWGLAGPEALTEYARLGWRVRMLGTESLPELKPTAARLIEKTEPQSAHTVWWSVVPSLDAPWEWIFTAVHNSQARTRQQAIRALYGEDIPPATLFLSFGKPFVSPELMPPLLMDQVHCYWTQRPGYELTQQEWRTICMIMPTFVPLGRKIKLGEQNLSYLIALPGNKALLWD